MNPKIILKLLETINCAILIVNKDGYIILSNAKAREIFHPQNSGAEIGSPHLLEGINVKKFFLPDDHEFFLPNIFKITETQGEFEGEALLTTLDGRRFFALLSTNKCQIEGGRGIVFTIHDITNLKHIEKTLKKSERLAFLGRMLHDISHQIRNPILSIGGFARRIKEIKDVDKKGKKYAEVILHECMRLELLLERLTEFLNMPRPNLRPVEAKELRPILNDAADEALTKAQVDGEIEIIWNDLSNKITRKILIDKEMLKHAITQIIINALESYKENAAINNKHIIITIMPATQELDEWSYIITIEDNGIGIKEENLSKVFDPFFTTKTGHIGMGLTLSKRIIDELYGDIDITSTPSKGALIKIYLNKDRRRLIRQKNLT